MPIGAMVLADIAMSIHERKTKTKGTTWVVRWRDPSGAPKEKTFKLKRDAVTFEARMLTEMAHGAYRDPRNDRITLATWHQKWWPNLETSGLSRGTLLTYESILRLHILPDLGARPMSSIRRIDIETWMATKSKAGLSASTLTKAKSLLGRLFASGIDNAIVTSNPVLGIRFSGGTPTKVRDPLDHDQIDAVVAELPAEYRALALVLAYCGLRPSEAIYLRRCHLLDGKTLLVDGALVERHGILEEGPTKTGKVRQVPIMTEAREALRDHLETRPTDPDTRIFVSTLGTDIRLSNFRRVLRRAAADSGIGMHITPYNFRHTCASLLARSSVSIALAAKVMGHHPNVFLATYAHVYADDLDLAAEALDDSRANWNSPRLRAV